MHPAFARIEHRPWPLPVANWSWRQCWLDLLFAHWPVPASAVRKLVPPGLAVDEFQGTTWVGVVPFRMAGVTRRPLPGMPWISDFPELDLRLYVERDDRPGVWFLSLDAGNPLAVWAARRWFFLPYYRARMSLTPGDERLAYHSRRTGPAPMCFEADYGPVSEPYEAKPGTLEYWLTERYCLYAQDPAGCLYRGEIHHVPWPLQTAEATIVCNDLPTPFGLALDGPPALLHYAKRLDAVLWPLERIAEPCRKAERLPAQVRPAFGGA